MTPRSTRLLAALILAGSTLNGCMRFKPDWDSTPVSARAASGVVDADLDFARAASRRAIDVEGLRAAMAAHEKVLAEDPDRYEALVTLADHSILMGTAYTESRDAKRALYDRAMRLGELAMYTNPEFKRLADGGARPWEACGALTEREMSAMMVWMTALLYKFKECMTPLVRVFNIRWMTHLDPMLDRMEQLDESWEEGAVPFTRAFYYFVVPRSLGGDRARAEASFERAVAMGPNRLVVRWGRARFFHVLTKNREGFVEDLRWVATRDPDTGSDTPAWKAYVQRDAMALLGDEDRILGQPAAADGSEGDRRVALRLPLREQLGLACR